MHYYAFNIGDYASHTKGLSLLEDLAYRRLIDEYYLAERPFNGCSTDVQRLIGMTAYPAEVDYVLTRFFRRDGDAWVHVRIENDIKMFKNKQEKAVKAGKASAESRRNIDNLTGVERLLNERSASVERTFNQPITNNQEPITINHKETKSNTSMSGNDGKQTEKIKKMNGYKSHAIEVLDFLNLKTGRAYRPVDANLAFIISRLKEGGTVEDCRMVIARKAREWEHDETMAKYLRPATLFNKTKFAQYTGELVEMK